MSSKFKSVFAVVFIFQFPLVSNFARADSDWNCPRDQSLENPIKADAASSTRGRFIALENGCIDCHGVQGSGDGAASAKLERTPANWRADNVVSETDGCLFWKLTTGRRPMPSNENLSADDRWNLVNFIRSLQH